MQPTLLESLRKSELAQPWEAVETAETREAMMAAGGELARALVLGLMGQVLARRAAQPMSWPGGEACGQRLQSKGWAPRQGTGVVGTVRWQRRVGRCPRGCKLGQVAPLDRALGLGAYARTGGVLQELACLLAVLVPCDRTARL